MGGESHIHDNATINAVPHHHGGEDAILVGDEDSHLAATAEALERYHFAIKRGRIQKTQEDSARSAGHEFMFRGDHANLRTIRSNAGEKDGPFALLIGHEQRRELTIDHWRAEVAETALPGV